MNNLVDIKKPFFSKPFYIRGELDLNDDDDEMKAKRPFIKDQRERKKSFFCRACKVSETESAIRLYNCFD